MINLRFPLRERSEPAGALPPRRKGTARPPSPADAGNERPPHSGDGTTPGRSHAPFSFSAPFPFREECHQLFRQLLRRTEPLTALPVKPDIIGDLLPCQAKLFQKISEITPDATGETQPGNQPAGCHVNQNKTYRPRLLRRFAPENVVGLEALVEIVQIMHSGKLTQTASHEIITIRRRIPALTRFKHSAVAAAGGETGNEKRPFQTEKRRSSPTPSSSAMGKPARASRR